MENQNQMPSAPPPPPPSPPPSQQQYQPPAPPPPPPQYQQQYYQQPPRKNPIVKIIIILVVIFIVLSILGWISSLFFLSNFFSFFNPYSMSEYADQAKQLANQAENYTNQINNQVNNSMNQNQPVVWKTFKNSMFGFQFNYPSDIGQVVDLSFSYESKEDFGAGPVALTQGSDLSFGVSVDKKGCLSESFIGAEVSDIMVDGISSKKYRDPKTGAFFVCSKNRGYAYELSFTTMDGDKVISQDNIKMFEKILSSFKFTN